MLCNFRNPNVTIGTSNNANTNSIKNIFLIKSTTSKTLKTPIPTMPATSIKNMSFKSNLPIIVFLLSLIFELIFMVSVNSFLSL